MSANKRLIPATARGFIAGTSLTTSYATLLAPGSRVVGLIFLSSCDQLVDISLDGGTTTWMTIPLCTATAPIVIPVNFAAMGVEYSGTISAKETSTNVTAGSISVTAIRSE